MAHAATRLRQRPPVEDDDASSADRDLGAPASVVVTRFDPEHLRRMTEELDQARDLRRALIAASHDAIVATDEAERVVIFNPAAERLFGRPAAEVLGRLGLAELEPALGFLSGSTDGASLALDEIEITSADGEAVPVRVNAARISRRPGSSGWALFLCDLRALRRAERERREAERFATVGQTVASLAHGIKNILSGLEGGLYLAEAGRAQAQPERIDQGWGMLERNIRRMSSLIKDLLTLGKREERSFEQVSVPSLVQDVVELYRQTALQSGIELGAEIDPRGDTIWADGEGLHTCLANLVANAVDACRQAEPGRAHISVRSTRTDRALCLEVVDDGPGMTEENRQKVFRDCFSTKGSRGTGLGLLITRKIVEDHRGTIEVDSAPGRGSVFRILLTDTLPSRARAAAVE